MSGCMYLLEFMFLVFLGVYQGVELPGHMGVLVLVFLRNFRTIFHGGCSSLHSHQQGKRVPFSHPPQHLSSVFLSVITVLTGVRWYLIVVLIFISLIVSDIEHTTQHQANNTIKKWEGELNRHFFQRGRADGLSRKSWMDLYDWFSSTKLNCALEGLS